MTGTPVPATTRDVEVNGITLRVATWGALVQAKRAVLLVHGITANSQYWSNLGPALAARGWFSIAVDLRGRGRSSRPPHGYGLPFHAADLLSLCDSLGLERMHFVGHSLGALIGLYLAAVHPARVGKLVLVDAGGTLPADTIAAIAPALARLGTPYSSLDAYLETMLSAPHLAGSNQAFWYRYYRYDAEVRDDGTVTSNVPKAAIAEEQAALFLTRTDVLPEYVKAPTLIVRATEGLLGGTRGQLLPAAEAERLRGLIPGSQIVEIPGTNHYTIVLNQRFSEAVLTFLED
ncbi:MAG: alpha/beta fold hydrolase [Thermomicrobiales bacterium]